MCELDNEGNLVAIHETKKIYRKDGKIVADKDD
jgi:hypothetical protein